MERESSQKKNSNKKENGWSLNLDCVYKKVFYCFRKVNWLLAFLFDWKVGRLFYRMQMICICSTIYTLLIKFLFEDFISGKFNLENEKFLCSIHTNSMRYWKFRCSAHLVKNTRASYFILKRGGLIFCLKTFQKSELLVDRAISLLNIMAVVEFNS